MKGNEGAAMVAGAQGVPHPTHTHTNRKIEVQKVS
jgi:hypothetical protein